VTIWVGKYSTMSPSTSASTPDRREQRLRIAVRLHRHAAQGGHRRPPANLTSADQERIRAVQQEMRRGTE